MEFKLKQPVKKITVEAVITRADGTVEDMGVVASCHLSYQVGLMKG
jgi:hypothetical protein